MLLTPIFPFSILSILKQAKANPGKAAAKKEKADAKRERRKESGSVKKMG